MEVIIRATLDACTSIAATIVAKHLRERKCPVLGLATGSTPERLYAELIAMFRRGEISFGGCTTFNLDEYVGLDASHPQSYHYDMRTKLFDHVDLEPSRTHLLDGCSTDLRAECRDYEQRISTAGGIHLQILGIGANGHIGFNEPFGSLSSRTWVKILSRRTLEDNARYFQDRNDVPRQVITMGVGTILKAAHCLVMAFGRQKAEAVCQMIEGPVTARCPASALQLHRRTTVILDEPAACLLQHRADFEWIERNKLPWQRYD